MYFFYSFIQTLMHSLWQSALLVFLYGGIKIMLDDMHPLQKRNVLYNFLVAQIFMSVFTFCTYFFALSNNISFFRIVTFNWFFKYSNVVFYTYIIIVSSRIITLYFQWYLFKKKYKVSLITPPVDIKMYTKLMCFRLGIKRKVSIWYSEKLLVPVTFGFLKPIILLPISLVNDISIQEIETIILHELAHIRGKDYLLNWLLVMVETIYFFNPFIKILVDKLKIEREKNCDVQVINFNYDEILYAQVLLKIAKNGCILKKFKIGAVEKSTQLLKRILFFSNKDNFDFKNTQSNFIIFITLPFLIFTIIFLHPFQKKYAGNNTNAAIVFHNIKHSKPSLVSSTEEALSSPITFAKQKIAKVKKEISSIKSIKLPSLIDSSLFVKTEQVQVDELFKQISYNEIQLDSIKELFYTVETAKGKMIKSFKLYKLKGKWIVKPQWIITEINADTTKQNKKVEYMDIDSIQ